jgi:hypothetical protein
VSSSFGPDCGVAHEIGFCPLCYPAYVREQNEYVRVLGFGPALKAPAIPRAPQRIVEVDFIARLAMAWNGEGDQTLRPPVEHQALLAIAHLPGGLHHARWEDLAQEERYKLLGAARRAIEFGRQCAWIFGDGSGARF